MNNHKSILSNNVKEKIIKSVREGKEINTRVSEITIDAVKEVSEASDKTIENIESISWGKLLREPRRRQKSSVLKQINL